MRAPMAALLIVSACAGEAARDAALQVHDSAGVRIVTIDATAAWPAAAVGATPVVEVGARAGEPGHELFQVRSALRLDDGTLVIANGGSNELRFFDARGAHVRTVGGTGEGPGEFQGLSNLMRAGADSILAFDRWLQRVTVFTTGGEPLGTLAVATGAAAAIARLEDGRFVPTRFLSAMPRRPRGLYHDTATLVVADGRVADTIARIVVLDWFSHGGEGPPTALPTGIVTHVAARAGEVIVASEAAVRVLRSDGTLASIVQFRRPSPAPAQAWRTLVDARIARASREELDGGLEARLDEVPVPDALPFVDGLLAAPDGSLWLREFRADPRESSTWWVLEEAGEPRLRITVPAHLTLLAVGADHVVARSADDLGIERVGVYGFR